MRDLLNRIAGGRGLAAVARLRALIMARPMDRAAPAATAALKNPAEQGRGGESKHGGQADAQAATGAIIAHFPDPLLILTPDLRVCQANRAARTLCGSDPVGERISRSIRAPHLQEHVAQAFGDGMARQFDLSLPPPHGADYRVRIRPLDPPGAAPARMMLLFQDMTSLAATERMRADFVANLGHELRTPLTALIGFIETLQGPAGEDTPNRQRFLEIMADQAGRMSRLIDDLLDLSRIELEEHRLPERHIALPAILREVVEMLRLKAGAREMDLRLEIEEDLPTVRGERDLLFQLFQNLIDNAVKYGARGTAVAIDARRVSARRLSVSVSDRGPGIATDHLPRLTERFYRVDVGRSRRAGGTGLGLAIAKHIANRHRGRLRISSVVNEGSRFELLLPIPEEGADGEGDRNEG